jgi:F0F1-type ATP synthase assembly protein I
MDKKNNKRLLDNQKAKAYLKYSGMAFQIFAYLIIGVLIGKQLDKYFNVSKPYFTALCTIIFLSVYFMKLVYDLKQPPK